MRRLILAVQGFLIALSVSVNALAFDVPGFGGLGWLAMGTYSGDVVDPEQSVYGPGFSLELHGELSFAFAYLGFGYNRITFDDQDPLEQKAVNVETGDNVDVEASASADLFHVEGGLAHGFRFGDSAFGIRPGLGYGVTTGGPVDRIVTNCSDCYGTTVLDDYKGGPYLRPQLLLYAKGKDTIAFGLGVSYQHFFTEGAAPGLTSSLMFNLTLGGGDGF